MTQYLKFLVLSLALFVSSNLQSTDFFFSATGTLASPGDGSNVNNWLDGNGDPATAGDFLLSNTFLSNGATCIDLAGLTVGGCTFSNNVNNTTILYINTGTLTISESVNPSWVANVLVTGSIVQTELNKSGSTIAYTYNGLQTLLPLEFHWNLKVSNSNGGTTPSNCTKHCALARGLEVKGDIIDESTSSTVTIRTSLGGIKLSSTTSFSGTGITDKRTTFRIEKPWTDNGLITSAPFYYINDSRSTKTYPATWMLRHTSPASGDTTRVNPGTYDALTLIQSTVLGGDVTVSNTLTFPTSANTLNLNGFSLVSSGSTSNSVNIKFIGSQTSNLTISSNMTLNFVNGSTFTNGQRTLKNLTIGGSGVTVTLGNWLNITGGTSSSGYGKVDVIAASNNLYTQGYLTLKSNEYGTAMISSNPGTIAYNSSSNNGTLLIENYIAGNSTKGRQYRFLASPVSGGVFWQWRDSSNSRTGRGTHITGKIGTANIANDSFDISTTNHPSAFYYDETKAGNTTGIGNTSASEDAGWARLTNAKTGTIENGKGYRVLIRGDRSITLTSSTTTTPVNTTIQTRGGYVAGPVSVPITNSGIKSNNGINLVGNPYACAVDWVTVQSNSTSVDPTYVAFDVSSKSYQSYNATGGGGLMSRYISPGQGFLVYTTAASTNLVFPTSSKTTAQAGGRIFTEIKNNHLVTRLIKDSGTYDATIIYFIKGATNYYDAFDAGHIENGNVNLSSVDSTNTLYNLNCMDSLVGSRIITLSLYGTPKGTYTMAFDDVNTFKNHDVYLIDNYLQKTTKVDDMTQYLVDVNSDKFSYAEGRLAISFEPKPVTSVVTVNKTNIFNISPNPVKDQLIVKMDDQTMGTIEYEIFNVSGQTMLNGTLDSTETKINTSKLMTGIYFINLRANNQTQTIKFIK